MRISLLFLFAGFLIVQTARADNSRVLPEISRLDSRDIGFRQYQEDVESARRFLFSSREVSRRSAVERIAGAMTIYSYTPLESDDLFAIAARCNIPYGTLVSINRLSHREDMAAGKPILLPSSPGIFVPESPESDLEKLMLSARASGVPDGNMEDGVLLSIPVETGVERFVFFPGDDLTPTERIYFLNRGFRFPLINFRVSSNYGPRINPVTGRAGVHGGIDLAAGEGTEVFAVRDGIVADLGSDPVLGKYVIISHENNWMSLYGHLSAIDTVLRSELRSGSLIGKVGSTGQSTGPHLHFELRQNGRTVDPAELLGIFQGSAEP